jgi:low density lipoprotein receptor-related protein 5/6
MRPLAIRGVISLFLLALAVGGLLAGAAGASGGKMYWTVDEGDGVILRANLDGTQVGNLVPYDSVDNPQGIALDLVASKMYWADDNGIYRANLDGSEKELLPVESNGGIALDVTGGKMYYPGGYAGIQRANLDGTGVEDLVMVFGFGIALDLAAGKMYWTTLGGIQRANLDGSDVEDLVVGLTRSEWIALDVAAGKMYWTDSVARKVQRANLDGTAVEDLVVVGPDHSPRGIALDAAGGKMYWGTVNESYGTIWRANLDGTGVETLVTGYVWPAGITLDLRVGGLATGLQPTKVICSNLTTGQRLKIIPQPGARSWDCQGAGLGVDAGDLLRMRVRGPALDLPIGGSAINFAPSRVICRNFTTGQRVKIVPPPYAESWDCTAAGLVVSPGDLVRMRVRGSEP